MLLEVGYYSDQGAKMFWIADYCNHELRLVNLLEKDVDLVVERMPYLIVFEAELMTS